MLDTRDPAEALRRLRELGSAHVFLEGGPIVAAGFVRAGLVDRVVGYLAPALLGSGLPVVADLGIDTIDRIQRLRLTDVADVGGDVRLTLVAVQEEAS
jgi:diaminohydroxyphosphoribosylaminopyrimidine deaminase/5-amino-6-(5-phosphoribosylamino)uracil reductase